MSYDISSVIKENDTAFYTFDILILKKRIDFLKSFFTQNIILCYAVKANTFITKDVNSKIDKFEICSMGEFEICRALEIPYNKMVISGVFKETHFIESLIMNSEFNGVITIESLTQFNLLNDLSIKYNQKINLLLRLTSDNQFGINEFDIEKIIKNNNPFIHIDGIQFFSNTQKFSLKKIKREIEYIDNFLIHLEDDYGFTTKTLEYGPGLAYSYFIEDEFNELDYLTEFNQILQGMLYKTNIILELGRSIAASCGKYYTYIVDKKQNSGINYVLVDGGMHQIVYYGQQMAMKHPKVIVVGKENETLDKVWNICGSLCSTNDIIVKQIKLPCINIGDIICFENTGAYSMIEGLSLFLSRALPKIYLIEENGNIECVRDSFETLLLNMPKRKKIINGKTN